jgi:lactose/L-arabinose transport system ATP-binding protein
MATVTLRNVVKRFGTVEVIHGADLDIQAGEFVVFVGPSGCGKSTLLRMIAGLEDISGGEVLIDGQVVNDAEPADRGIAMVFQSYALYPHMTVTENLSFGLRMNGNDKADTERRVKKAMDILQIGPLANRRPKALSGGQRQRVAIGRAIVREPKVFLFDEPLSNLDAELRVQMRVEIAKLHAALDATMIYVTHDQTEAMTLADKIVVLRDGRIEQVGRPLDLYIDPDNIFVAGFVGSPRMNFLAAKAGERTAAGLTVTLTEFGNKPIILPIAETVPPGTAIQFGIRPEHFTGQGGGQCDITLEVDVAEHLGASTFIYARAGSPDQIIVQREATLDGAPQDKSITIGIPAKRALIFSKEGRRIR